MFGLLKTAIELLWPEPNRPSPIHAQTPSLGRYISSSAMKSLTRRQHISCSPRRSEKQTHPHTRSSPPSGANHRKVNDDREKRIMIVDMKPFDFKYGRKQETDDEKEEKVILMEESDDEDFGSFQQEIEAAEMGE
ncbi:hypothetical protein AVEN_61044-1 [Araneus ventricosus]|uniref:Uncharacterized protein n=1 Tax=Araneus ventricosus TaxID=182803 RepID=A0A4Y2DWQ0_ARAVE|nr:hypothetical protein AVEN_61044-1 [Araneus ventricosus]